MRVDEGSFLTSADRDHDETKVGHTMVNPNNSGGNVERWLVEVEVMMKKGLAYSIDTSMLDHDASDRMDWVQKWPGQVRMCDSLCASTAQDIRRGDRNDSIVEVSANIRKVMCLRSILSCAKQSSPSSRSIMLILR